MMQPKFNYNISEELFKSIEDQFGGAKIVEKYLESKNDSVFKEWGKGVDGKNL